MRLTKGSTGPAGDGAMRTWLTVWLCLVWLPTGVMGVERRPPKDIPVTELASEMQRSSSGPEFIDLAWWIPVEYWEATFAQDKSILDAPREAWLQALRPFFMVGVVQADVPPGGALDFFTEEQTRNGLTLTYTRPDGPRTTLHPLDRPSPDLILLQQFIRPVLAAAMGDMGKNVRLFTYSDVDAHGRRILSPFEAGELHIALSSRNGENRSTLHLELPLNSLFVARLCPSGKPAHISWKYCPWDGTKLPE
jgi:hypothetical protein